MPPRVIEHDAYSTMLTPIPRAEDITSNHKSSSGCGGTRNTISPNRAVKRVRRGIIADNVREYTAITSLHPFRIPYSWKR